MYSSVDGETDFFIEMSASASLSWKEIAWNGIRFSAPSDWEIGKIGLRYLLLENEFGPLLEIKWNKVGKTFSHEEQFQRLSEFKKRVPGHNLFEYSLPTKWTKALKGFQAKGFSWETDTVAGMGVILYCAVCRRAVLIQFFSEPSKAGDDVSADILNSFKDHSRDDQVTWSIFDIRASLPKIYRLERFRFEPGRYRLDFNCSGQRIFLHRWSPASVLLDKKDLNRFADNTFDLSGGTVTAVNIKGFAAIEWEAKPSGHWFDRLKFKPPFRFLRLWHLTEANRILGVMAEGKKPFDINLLDRICARYESL